MTLKYWLSAGSGYIRISALSLVLIALFPMGAVGDLSLSNSKPTELLKCHKKQEHLHESSKLSCISFVYLSISCSMRMVSLILQRILFSNRLQILTMGIINVTLTICASTGVPEHSKPRNRATIFEL